MTPSFRWPWPPRWRKALLFLAGLGLAYVLSGFFLFPLLAQYLLEETVGPALHRQISVREIRCNPFLLTVDVRGFVLSDTDGECAAFESLHADLELSSLFRLAAFLRDVRLENPRLRLSLDQAGQTNFADLFSEPGTGQPTVLFPCIIEPFNLENGVLILHDMARNATHTVDQITLRVPRFSTRQQDWATFMTPTLSFRVNGAPLSMQGNTIPFDNSLKTEFSLDLTALDLPPFWPYAPATPGLRLSKGTLTLQTKLSFEQRGNSLPQLSLQGQVSGQDIEVTDQGRLVFSVARMDLLLEDISPWDMRVDLKSAQLEKPFLDVVRKKDGRWNWQDYFPLLAENSTGNATQTGSTAALALLAPDVRITDGRIVMRDETLDSPLTKELADLHLELTDLSTEQGAPAAASLSLRSAQNEEISVNGTFVLNPPSATAQVTARKLRLADYAAYFQDALPLKLSAGQADIQAGLLLPENATSLLVNNATLRLRDLALQAPDNAGSIQVGKVDLGPLAVDPPRRLLQAGRLEVENLRLATDVDRQGRARLLAALSPPTSAAQSKSPPNQESWTVRSTGGVMKNASLLVGQNLEPLRLHRLDIGPLSVDANQTLVQSADVSCSLDLVLNRDGQWDLATLFAPEPAQGAAQPVQSAGPGWTLKHFALTDCTLSFTDQSLFQAWPQGVRLSLDQIHLKAEDLSSDMGRPVSFNLSGQIENSGSIQTSATLTPSTLTGSGSTRLTGIPLALLTAYVSPYAAVTFPDGRLGGHFDWRLEPSGRGQITGNAQCANVRVNMGRTKTELAGCKTVDFRQIRFQFEPLGLHIGQISLLEPRASFRINEQGVTTLDRIAVKRASAEKKARTGQDVKSGQDMSFDLDLLILKHGRLSFADARQSPAFEGTIAPLDMTVRGLSMSPDKRADVQINALLDGSAPLAGQGWVAPFKNPPAANATVSLRNLDMVPLSPYAGRYLGYLITQGRLDWDMTLDTQASKLNMQNAFKARHLELGEKTSSPEASTAPVKLGLSLLRDMSGNIAINLPVKGDLNDPSLNIGHIVGQAFFGLIIKTVASPFTLLTSLIPGNSGQDISRIPFSPGLATPEDSARKILRGLAEALKRRPDLTLAISGQAAPEADRAALGDLRKKGLFSKAPHITDEDLIQLATSRAEHVKANLEQEFQIDPARLVLNKHGIQSLSGAHAVLLEIR